jgi:hypothetical protein
LKQIGSEAGRENTLKSSHFEGLSSEVSAVDSGVRAEDGKFSGAFTQTRRLEAFDAKLFLGNCAARIVAASL